MYAEAIINTIQVALFCGVCAIGVYVASLASLLN